MKRRSFNILVVKLAAIGDVIMSLPLLCSLREKYPGAHITWICGKQVKPLLEATNLINRVIEVDEKKLLNKSFIVKVTSLLKIWARIGGRRFNLAFTLHPDPRYRLICWPIICKDRRYLGKNLLRFYPVPGRYHAVEYVNLLQEEEGPVSQALKFPTICLQETGRYLKLDIVIAPGGAKNVLADDSLRRWPIGHYASLIEKLNEHDLQIAVTGSKEDEWILPHLEGRSFINLVGQNDLIEMMSVLQQTRLLITHDSGPLHLAKLANCQVLALFGPTNPWEKVGIDEKVRVLWGGERLACRPCYNGKTYARCRKNQCLSAILPETVYRETLNLMRI